MVSKESIKLFVGLGNPGDRYTMTRHNVGFKFIDFIVDQKNFPTFKKKNNYYITEKIIYEKKIIIIKPRTYMNLSGNAVLGVSSFYKISTNDVMVIYDDVDLKPGKIRIKKGGGHGGHNGIRNIISCVGSEFWRFKIGVGRPMDYSSTSDYVLQNFTKKDYLWLKPLLVSFNKEFPLLVNKEFDLFLNNINKYNLLVEK